MRTLALPLVVALAAAACSPTTPQAADPDPAPAATPLPAAPPGKATPSPNPTATANPAADGGTLTLAGLGPLRIGRPVPAGSGWASQGAQIPGSDCRTVASSRYPGVYALLEGGTVRRISVGGASRVRIDGIGPGSPERALATGFPGFREAPHRYEDAPAKYLTTPGLTDGEVGLRFEIGTDRRVRLVHVGTMPQLAYVEGCA